MSGTRDRPPNITIYTDAALCSQTNVGGWAAWIKAGPKEVARVYGRLKYLAVTSNEAELMAIANAIHVAHTKFGPWKGNLVIVVTDSQAAIHKFAFPRKPSHSEMEKKVLEWCIEKRAEWNFRLKVNKVKGHTQETDVRSNLNRELDKLAKAAMRAARAANATLELPDAS